jgi:tRNA-2-methylthio-N6-dimethylallyladenosine synthase
MSIDRLAMDQMTQPGLCIKTFGCQMNEYDSEKIVHLLAASHRLVESPEEAELIIVNSCSVRDKAEHKLFSLLGELRDLKESRPSVVLGVAGCVAQQEGQELLRRNSGVDFVVGTHNLSLIPALVQRARRGGERQVAVDFREEWEELPAAFSALELEGRTGVRALVAIQRGCSKRCTFCVVPTTRGEEVSRSAEEILREVRLKASLGAREVVLLGQTVNSYGRDLHPRASFAALIRRIAQIKGVERIRFTSPHPADVHSDFLDLYAEVPQLAPHIHLPVQSGSNRILRLMKRNYRRERYLQIVEELRNRSPQLAITTDIIVGFPTETDEDFALTLELLREVRYHSAFLFKYSPRPNTAALSRFSASEEVPPASAQARFQTLQEAQDEISLQHNASLLGRQVQVLVEGASNNIRSLLRGRIPQNTLCEFAGDSADIGSVVHVQVEHASAHGLRGNRLS